MSAARADSKEKAVDKIWLQQYPQGIPAEIDAGEFASLKDILEQSCARFGALPAYGNMGVSNATEPTTRMGDMSGPSSE